VFLFLSLCSLFLFRSFVVSIPSSSHYKHVFSFLSIALSGTSQGKNESS
jgi:hypothetical protein